MVPTEGTTQRVRSHPNASSTQNSQQKADLHHQLWNLEKKTESAPNQPTSCLTIQDLSGQVLAPVLTPQRVQPPADRTRVSPAFLGLLDWNHFLLSVFFKLTEKGSDKKCVRTTILVSVMLWAKPGGRGRPRLWAAGIIRVWVQGASLSLCSCPQNQNLLNKQRLCSMCQSQKNWSGTRRTWNQTCNLLRATFWMKICFSFRRSALTDLTCSSRLSSQPLAATGELLPAEPSITLGFPRRSETLRRDIKLMKTNKEQRDGGCTADKARDGGEIYAAGFMSVAARGKCFNFISILM